MRPRQPAIALILGALVAGLSTPPTTNAYTYCGSHDDAFPMVAHHWNSEFWVDMLDAEANKWNAVHSTLRLGRVRQSTIPVGNDGNNVIGWIGEADLNSSYNLSWSGTVGWTIAWKANGCGNVQEADLFFNPSISLFTAQTQVPYSLGYQEIALHELGHVLTHDHENGDLAVMTSGNAVSDVLYTSDKVGWLRSASLAMSTTDREDMGAFPLRNAGAAKTYGSTQPASATAGSKITVKDFTIQNLSSGIAVSQPTFQVRLEGSGAAPDVAVGSFFWNSVCATRAGPPPQAAAPPRKVFTHSVDGDIVRAPRELLVHGTAPASGDLVSDRFPNSLGHRIIVINTAARMVFAHDITSK
jgi:hypothetical protein